MKIMNNYWLSEYSSPDNKDQPENDMPKDDSEDTDDPHNKLNDRQKMMYDMYENIVETNGKFEQTSKADGAHYAPAEANPFKEEGLVCGNCVFYLGGGGCELVAGQIEHDAICKLWIIPEELIKS